MANHRKENLKTTKKGYLRTKRIGYGGRKRMMHDVIREQYYGPIPEGYQIHHKDFDKTNNDISNLQLVTCLEHKRLHEGCKFIDGVWYKPCKVCGESKPCDEDHWYFRHGWITGRICRSCYVKKVVDFRRKRVAQGWKRKEYREK